jgi:protein-S-isoprenylcysteine O-methyltransferase Ste14
MTVPMEKKVILAFLYILIFPALILILSGNLTWPEGWLFSIWFILLCFSTVLYLYKKDPALLEERYQKPGTGNQEGWDRYVVYGIVIGFTLWIVTMPLDAQRFGWSPAFPLWLHVIGGAGLAGSFFLFFRSFTDNTFLSPLVRIQEDRKQQVVSTGVYGFVRHPMYLGAILMFIGTPMLLGSLYGVLVGCALTVLLMARIRGEEAMLNRDLAGYQEYARHVRYRLIPFIW